MTIEKTYVSTGLAGVKWYLKWTYPKPSATQRYIDITFTAKLLITKGWTYRPGTTHDLILNYAGGAAQDAVFHVTPGRTYSSDVTMWRGSSSNPIYSHVKRIDLSTATSINCYIRTDNWTPLGQCDKDIAITIPKAPAVAPTPPPSQTPPPVAPKPPSPGVPIPPTSGTPIPGIRPGFGKIHNGTSFVPIKGTFIHDGTKWCPIKDMKIHDGSSWKAVKQ